MSNPGLRFDDSLALVRSDELKSMVTMWGGKSSMRKDVCIEVIRQGLADPAKVHAAVARLEPYERAALAFVKQAGGVVEFQALGLGLIASGIPLPPRVNKAYSNISDAITRTLIKRGVLLSSYSRDPGYLASSFGGTATVFSDERLLAAVDTVDTKPFAIAATSPPPASTRRLPPAVVLDVVGFLQAIESMDGLGLTQKGMLRANDVRKVQRAVQWPDDVLIVDGLRFEDAFNGLISALRFSGWLAASGDVLRLTQPVNEIATLAYPELIAALLNGFLRTGEWREPLRDSYIDNYGNLHRQGRLALSIGLKSLPLDVQGFFAFDDFDQALFARIGDYFSLRFPPHKPYFYNKSPQDVRQLEEEWRHKLRTEWLGRERIWLERVLTGWLYFLGLVEIGLVHHKPVSFRLTELGRAVFHPELAARQGAASAADVGQTQTPPATWVVQPNFDIVVYLDRTSPTQLAFLERHAERTNAQQYVAHYRLTRESVYQGLESGSSLDDLLAGLRTGAHSDLPKNVVVELSEWAALRERIALYRRGQVLEFPNDEARDTALAAGLQGQPVGDRYLLLHIGQQAATPDSQLRPLHQRSFARVDYAAPLPKCLSASEDGVLTLQKDYIDLLIESQLDQWAERASDHQWCLTAGRVAAAVRSGSRLNELTSLLTKRLRYAIPPLLAVALRNWADSATTAEVATVAVMRCTQADTIAALKTSKLLQPYILGELASDLLLVDTKQLAAFKEHLAWAGFKIDQQLRVKRQKA